MIILKESQNLETLLLSMKQFPIYENQPKSTLYHNTKSHSLESILQNGILLNKARYADYEGNGIWTTSVPNQKGYGGITIAFDSTGYDLEKVNSEDFRVWEDINTEDILFVDYFIETSLRLSDMPHLIKEYGYDKVMYVIKQQDDDGEAQVPFYITKKLVDKWL